MKEVDWAEYSRQYDLMAENNPAYQELLRHCLDTVRGWKLRPGDVIGDFGAGTGNFSIELAREYPRVEVFHFDSDHGMNEMARLKAERHGLRNWHHVHLDLDSDDWKLPTPLRAAITIHTLYTVKDPSGVVSRIFDALTPDGYMYAADVGRRVALWDWTRYMTGVSLRKNGLLSTMKLFMNLSTVRKVNRHISRSQKEGVYWLHGLSEYKQAFERIGFNIIFESEEFFRGYDDLVIARKAGEIGIRIEE